MADVGVTAADMVPGDGDLPGGRWFAIDEGFSAEDGEGPGAMFDCVGPDFPEEAVIESAASPHFVRPPSALVHGIGVRFASTADALAAEQILAGPEFAGCLGRSVAADIEHGATDAELLGVDVEATPHGHRVRFTGGDAGGVRPVNLDIACVRIADAVGVLWCGDSPGRFPEDDVEHLMVRIRGRRGS